MQWGSRIKATIWVSPWRAGFFQAETGALEAALGGNFAARGALGAAGFLAAARTGLEAVFGLAADLDLEAAFGAVETVSAFFFRGIGSSRRVWDLRAFIFLFLIPNGKGGMGPTPGFFCIFQNG